MYRDWRRISDAYPGDRVFVGEIWVQSPERLARYLRPAELHTAFNFAFLAAPWEADALRTAIDDTIRTLAVVGAPPTWVLSNHDVVRHVSRYGNVRRARAAALLMLALPGSTYIYQGEELGLPEVTDLPAEVRRDPEFRRSGGREPGRDGCRVPLPWSGTTPSYGFGPGPAAWLPQPSDWAALTAERQLANPASMLGLYRAALRHRRALPSLGDGPLAWLPSAPEVLAFRREPGLVCVVNVGEDPAPLPAAVRGARPVLTSGPVVSTETIAGATAAWYLD
ncbi:alpha-amylase family glycosyl hydrolase [Actinoplanes sp. NPDC026619]|uniref:alpha-amylase family glycosyl hydrolase n=1 Tax=Actinoplanes sp. NPDC026619 TaxID=3155798 RepID=UPI0033E9AE67